MLTKTQLLANKQKEQDLYVSKLDSLINLFLDELQTELTSYRNTYPLTAATYVYDKNFLNERYYPFFINTDVKTQVESKISSILISNGYPNTVALTIATKPYNHRILINLS